MKFFREHKFLSAATVGIVLLVLIASPMKQSEVASAQHGLEFLAKLIERDHDSYLDSLRFDRRVREERGWKPHTREYEMSSMSSCQYSQQACFRLMKYDRQRDKVAALQGELPVEPSIIALIKSDVRELREIHGLPAYESDPRFLAHTYEIVNGKIIRPAATYMATNEN